MCRSAQSGECSGMPPTREFAVRQAASASRRRRCAPARPTPPGVAAGTRDARARPRRPAARLRLPQAAVRGGQAGPHCRRGGADPARLGGGPQRRPAGAAALGAPSRAGTAGILGSWSSSRPCRSQRWRACALRAGPRHPCRGGRVHGDRARPRHAADVREHLRRWCCCRRARSRLAIGWLRRVRHGRGGYCGLPTASCT